MWLVNHSHKSIEVLIDQFQRVHPCHAMCHARITTEQQVKAREPADKISRIALLARHAVDLHAMRKDGRICLKHMKEESKRICDDPTCDHRAPARHRRWVMGTLSNLIDSRQGTTKRRFLEIHEVRLLPVFLALHMKRRWAA